MALCLSVPVPFETGDRHTINVGGELITVERLEGKAIRLGKSDIRKILAAEPLEVQRGFPKGGVFLVCSTPGIPDPSIKAAGGAKAVEVEEEGEAP